MTYQPENNVQKGTLHFFEFYFILGHLLKNSSISGIVWYFSNLTLYVSIDIKDREGTLSTLVTSGDCFNSLQSWKRRFNRRVGRNYSAN